MTYSKVNVRNYRPLLVGGYTNIEVVSDHTLLVDKTLMQTKWLLIGIGALVVLGFAYYALSPLWRVTRVDEAVPTQSTAVTSTNEVQGSGTAIVQGAGATVTGTAGHPASGTARIILSGDRKYVRYENFKTLNGPDLYVYLAKDLDAKEYVSLGRVKATEGNINYEIPSNINPSDYKYILTWCKTFGVLFNSAPIQ